MKNTFVLMQQVHGNNVVVVSKKDIGKIISNCDGLITNLKGVTLQVSTADCLPIMIKDTKEEVIAIVHAGWRGLEKEIIKKTIEKMAAKFKSDPANVIVGIGPHICKKHYEVKNDVAKYFTEITVKNDKMYLDLAQVAKNQLTKLGVKQENIKIASQCTYEDKNLPSFRRDNGNGRLVTSIVM